MLDLKVDDKVATSSEIPDILTKNGWCASQVSNVWSVSTCPSQAQVWDAGLLKKLGGPNLFSTVWEALKERKQAGHSKRPAVDEDLRPTTSKKHKSGTLKTPIAVSSTCMVSSHIETPILNSNLHSPPNVLINPVEAIPKVRRKRRANRNKLIATPKITEWLLKCPDSPLTPQDHQKTPVVSASDQKKTNKRRRKTAARKQEDPSRPSFHSIQVHSPAVASTSGPTAPDSACSDPNAPLPDQDAFSAMSPQLRGCLLYTSDAADE